MERTILSETRASQGAVTDEHAGVLVLHAERNGLRGNGAITLRGEAETLMGISAPFLSTKATRYASHTMALASRMVQTTVCKVRCIAGR